MTRKYLMLPYTLDDHFTFGYGSGLFNPGEKSVDARLWCGYTRSTREPGSFKEECVNTARLIGARAAELNRPVYVCLSGGMDSEVVVKAFLAAEVPFTTITFRFNGGLNSHELRFVNRFVARHQLKHVFFDMSILDWIKSDEAADMFHGAQAAAFSLMPHMKILSHVWFELGGLPVLGNGDIYLENGDEGWKYVELEYMLSWFRHAIRFRILGAIGFFQFTPEITLAMLRDPRIERLGRNVDSYANKIYQTSRFIKYSIYRTHWPDLAMRAKYSGQEFVKEEYEERAAELLAQRSDQFIDKFQLDYVSFRAMLEPDETAYLAGVAQQPLHKVDRTPFES